MEEKEKLDFLATKGATIPQTLKPALTFHSAKRIIGLEFNKRHKIIFNNCAKDRAWECLSSNILDFLHASAVAMFLLLSGHDLLVLTSLKLDLVIILILLNITLDKLGTGNIWSHAIHYILLILLLKIGELDH